MGGPRETMIQGRDSSGRHESDETQSLTASDFEVLNSENFFDKINDAFLAF